MVRSQHQDRRMHIDPSKLAVNMRHLVVWREVRWDTCLTFYDRLKMVDLRYYLGFGTIQI